MTSVLLKLVLLPSNRGNRCPPTFTELQQLNRKRFQVSSNVSLMLGGYSVIRLLILPSALIHQSPDFKTQPFLQSLGPLLFEGNRPDGGMHYCRASFRASNGIALCTVTCCTSDLACIHPSCAGVPLGSPGGLAYSWQYPTILA